MKRKALLSLLTLLFLLSSVGSAMAAPPPPPKPDYYVTAYAYKVDYTFTTWDYFPLPEPHFGAWFQLTYNQCMEPHYLAEQGDSTTAPYSGGIANWDWWAPPPNYPPTVLLVPKTFLDYPACGDYPCSGPRWTGSNYRATCYFN